MLTDSVKRPGDILPVIVTMIVAMSMALNVHAETGTGGGGGGGNSGTAGSGGAGNGQGGGTSPPNGSAGSSSVEGVGGAGKAGGSPGGAGGAVGTTSSTAIQTGAAVSGGSGGTSAPANGTGGGGGGGAGAFLTDIGSVTSAVTITGGNGGAAGDTTAGRAGGGGGGGGAGLMLRSLNTTSTLTVNANITGGNGSNPGAGASGFASGGGGGGTGVVLDTTASTVPSTTPIITLINASTIAGGNGANGAPGTVHVSGPGGGGAGAALVGSGISLVNSGAGVISGGTGGATTRNLYSGDGGSSVWVNGNGASISNDGRLVGGDGGTGGRSGSANRGGAGINATSSGTTNISITNTGSITGGTGTNTGASTGGAGINAVGSIRATNSGSITGGTGSGTGEGGAGIVGGTGSTITNASGGSINGGNGTSSAAGGVGITGADLAVTNSGGIVGGLAGDGTTRANAIAFTGGTNSLEIQAGSNVVGNAVAFSSADTFILGGSANASFDLAQIGAAAQYRGFGLYQKTGASTWALTGSTATTTPWTISAGTLQLGNGGTSGSIVGDVTNNGTLAFNRSDTLAYGGVISGTGSVSQIGSSVTVLTGANTYTGPTTVAAGSLYVNGDQSVATDLTSVASGATLGGTGTLGGNVSVADGGTLSPGDSGATPGQLSINGNLGLSAGSLLNYRFGQAGTVGGPLNDLTTVAGDLTLDGTLNVTTTTGGSLTPGIYRVISYGGALINNGLVLGTTPFPSTLSVQTAVANQVNLVNTTGLSLNYWDGAAGAKNNSTVNGGTGVWQNAGSNDNWTEATGAINAPFSDGSFAIFMAQPGTVLIDNSQGQVTVSGMQFASDGYVVSGGPITLNGAPSSIIRVGDGTASGAGYTATINAVLTGTSPIEKEDLGTLVLTGTNTYSGGTAINGGVLQIASDGNLGVTAGALSLDGGTLRTTANIAMARDTTLGSAGGIIETQSGTLTHNGVIAGAGVLTKTGAGTLALSGGNTYSGGTALKGGQITLGNNSALGEGAISMDEGTTLGFSVDGLNVSNAIVLTGTSDPIVDTGTFNETLSGIISGNGALTKAGTGTLILTALNTYNGPTTVQTGTLQAGAVSTFSAASAYSVGPGATLDTAGFHQDLAALQNAGTVSVLGASTGNTLRVTGAYVGQEGVLKLGTGLSSNGASVSDRLVLDGPGASASGHTSIQIASLAGLGAATTGNGVEVVSGLNGATTTAQTSQSAFSLANGHVDAGAFEYRLYAADSQGAGENWYLRSTIPVPPTPEGPTPPGVPTYRPEVPLLLALPAQMQQADLVMLGTFHQRIGDYFGTSASTSSGPAADPRQSWARVVSSNLDIEKSGIASPHADTHMSGVQAGTDLIAVDNWRAGVYVGYLKGSADVSGNAHGTTGNVGNNDLQSNYLGIYATWMDASGLYVDSVLQGGRHDYTIHPDIDPNVSGKADSVAASVEVGKPFALGGAWSIEPQAQLIYQETNPDNVHISGAKVSSNGSNGWVGRVGGRLKGDMVTSVGRLLPYTQVNVNHAHFSDSNASFIGPAGATTLKSPNGYYTAELAFGSTLALSPSTSLYGELGHQWSLGGDTTISSAVHGTLGVRVNW